MATGEQMGVKRNLIASIERSEANTIIVDESFIEREYERVDVTCRKDRERTTIPGKKYLSINIVTKEEKLGIIPCCPRMREWIDTNQIFKNIAGSYTVPSLNETINHCPFCGTKLKYRGIE
jgi:hypothetical protein